MTVKETSRDNRSARQVTRKAIPLEKAHVHDTAVLADTDFLDTDITPSDPPCLFRIQVQLDTAAVFSALVDDGSSEVTLEFNNGSQLADGVLHVFDMIINEDDNINFQCDQNANIDKFIVHEILWANQGGYPPQISNSTTAIIGAGTAVIGKVRPVTATGDEITDDTLDAVQVKERETNVETPFTGTGNLVVGTNKIAPGAAFELVEIELHLSAAPTTGTQNLVITKDDGVAAAYDLNILTIDLVANAVTDLIIKPAKKCKATDAITAAWTNADGATYGLVFKHRLL